MMDEVVNSQLVRQYVITVYACSAYNSLALSFDHLSNFHASEDLNVGETRPFHRKTIYWRRALTAANLFICQNLVTAFTPEGELLCGSLFCNLQ